MKTSFKNDDNTLNFEAEILTFHDFTNLLVFAQEWGILNLKVIGRVCVPIKYLKTPVWKVYIFRESEFRPFHRRIIRNIELDLPPKKKILC